MIRDALNGFYPIFFGIKCGSGRFFSLTETGFYGILEQGKENGG